MNFGSYLWFLSCKNIIHIFYCTVHINVCLFFCFSINPKPVYLCLQIIIILHWSISCLVLWCGELVALELPLQHDLPLPFNRTPRVRSIVSPFAFNSRSVIRSIFSHLCTASTNAAVTFCDVFADVSIKLDMLYSWHQPLTSSGDTSRFSASTSFYKMNGMHILIQIEMHWIKINKSKNDEIKVKNTQWMNGGGGAWLTWTYRNMHACVFLTTTTDRTTTYVRSEPKQTCAFNVWSTVDYKDSKIYK